MQRLLKVYKNIILCHTLTDKFDYNRAFIYSVVRLMLLNLDDMRLNLPRWRGKGRFWRRQNRHGGGIYTYYLPVP